MKAMRSITRWVWRKMWHYDSLNSEWEPTFFAGLIVCLSLFFLTIYLDKVLTHWLF